MKLHIFIFVCALLWAITPAPALAYSGVTDFLCELGLKYYQQGELACALHEFNKVLLVEPDHKLALRYISLIEEKLGRAEPTEEAGLGERKQAIRKALEAAEEIVIEEVIPAAAPRQEIKARPSPQAEEVSRAQIKPAAALRLDEQIKATQPDTRLELEIGRPLIIQGAQITRVLVTTPEMLSVDRLSSDKVEIQALTPGQTFLHIWDNQGRWTFKAQNIPARPSGPTLDELRRQEARKAENFKLRYALNRDDYYLGTKPTNLERESLSVSQWMGLDGETPYGSLDARARLAKLQDTEELTYLTVGLTDAQIEELADFDLRAFDYNMYGSELVMPGIDLRGVRFDQRLDLPERNYTVFWGREGRGAYGRLSPGLAEVKESFLEGGRFAFEPTEHFNYQVGYYHGYGEERDASLRKDSLDLMANLDYDYWKLSCQGGYDTEQFAYLLDSVLTLPNLRLRTEFRNIYPEYLTIVGRPSRLGEMGGLALLEYSGMNNLLFSQRVDVYRDRLYPNPERPGMWNIELDSNLSLRLNDNTRLDANFRQWDEKGKLSPRRQQSVGGGISQSVDFLKTRDLTFYANYQHEQTKDFNSVTNDYQRHKAVGGARLSLFEGCSLFASEEYSWLEEISPQVYSHPRAWEAGVDYDRQVGAWPLYASLRAAYRDERDAAGIHSYLAGEDYVELQSGLSFRPSDDWEIFVDGRYRKVWPDNPASAIYAEGEFITGARLVYDTGITWNPQGDIYGVVFKDTDGNGVQAEDEPGIGGVKVFLGKEKAQTTDEKGIFYFRKVRAKTAYLTLELSTAPEGFLPTTATTQEVAIKQGKMSTVSFGLTFRCEIVGSVFVDVNANSRFDADEQGLKDVVLYLEDGTQARSNDKGQFYFRKISVGEHTISLDVQTVPVHFLPKVPIKKELFLDEGMSYIYNIPLEPAK